MPPNDERRKEDNWGMGQLNDGSIVVLTPEEAAEFVRKRDEEESEEEGDVDALASEYERRLDEA